MPFGLGDFESLVEIWKSDSVYYFNNAFCKNQIKLRIFIAVRFVGRDCFIMINDKSSTESL